MVAGHGRVLFVDEHPDARGKEAYAADSDEIIQRRLGDGSEHRLVKAFVHPGQLDALLRQLDWQSHIRRDGDDWGVGETPPQTAVAEPSGHSPRPLWRIG